MNVLFIVINQVDKFEELIHEFQERGLHGGTIFDTQGMASVMSNFENHSFAQNLRGFLNKGRPFNKTIMMVVDDNGVCAAKEAMEKVVGDINRENCGIIFSVPVNYLWGLRGKTVDPSLAKCCDGNQCCSETKEDNK